VSVRSLHPVRQPTPSRGIHKPGSPSLRAATRGPVLAEAGRRAQDRERVRGRKPAPRSLGRALRAAPESHRRDLARPPEDAAHAVSRYLVGQSARAAAAKAHSEPQAPVARHGYCSGPDRRVRTLRSGAARRAERGIAGKGSRGLLLRAVTTRALFRHGGLTCRSHRGLRRRPRAAPPIRLAGRQAHDRWAELLC